MEDPRNPGQGRRQTFRAKGVGSGVPEPGRGPSAVGKKVVREGLAVRLDLLPQLALDPGFPVEDLHEEVLQRRRHPGPSPDRSRTRTTDFGTLTARNPNRGESHWV